jgi:hypothetical protein
MQTTTPPEGGNHGGRLRETRWTADSGNADRRVRFSRARATRATIGHAIVCGDAEEGALVERWSLSGEPSHGVDRVAETLIMAVVVFGGMWLIGWVLRLLWALIPIHGFGGAS